MTKSEASESSAGSKEVADLKRQAQELMERVLKKEGVGSSGKEERGRTDGGNPSKMLWEPPPQAPPPPFREPPTSDGNKSKSKSKSKNSNSKTRGYEGAEESEGKKKRRRVEDQEEGRTVRVLQVEGVTNQMVHLLQREGGAMRRLNAPRFTFAKPNLKTKPNPAPP
jgi:hypothetical protein